MHCVCWSPWGSCKCNMARLSNIVVLEPPRVRRSVGNTHRVSGAGPVQGRRDFPSSWSRLEANHCRPAIDCATIRHCYHITWLINPIILSLRAPRLRTLRIGQPEASIGTIFAFSTYSSTSKNIVSIQSWMLIAILDLGHVWTVSPAHFLAFQPLGYEVIVLYLIVNY